MKENTKDKLLIITQTFYACIVGGLLVLFEIPGWPLRIAIGFLASGGFLTQVLIGGIE